MQIKNRIIFSQKRFNKSKKCTKKNKKINTNRSIKENNTN